MRLLVKKRAIEVTLHTNTSLISPKRGSGVRPVNEPLNTATFNGATECNDMLASNERESEREWSEIVQVQLVCCI